LFSQHGRRNSWSFPRSSTMSTVGVFCAARGVGCRAPHFLIGGACSRRNLCLCQQPSAQPYLRRPLTSPSLGPKVLTGPRVLDRQKAPWHSVHLPPSRHTPPPPNPTPSVFTLQHAPNKSNFVGACCTVRATAAGRGCMQAAGLALCSWLVLGLSLPCKLKRARWATLRRKRGAWQKEPPSGCACLWSASHTLQHGGAVDWRLWPAPLSLRAVHYLPAFLRAIDLRSLGRPSDGGWREGTTSRVQPCKPPPRSPVHPTNSVAGSAKQVNSNPAVLPR
jgi:hypothetical protein